MKQSHKELPLIPSPFVREIHGKDGAALLDVHQARNFGLNPTGAKIWNMLQQHLSIDQIANELATHCAVPEQQIRDDVLEFIRSLMELKLLVPLEPQGNSGRFGRLKSFLQHLNFTTNGARK